MNNSDDIAIVKEILNGSPEAYELIVVRYQKPIFNYAVRMVKDTEDAKDIAQSVFVKAYEKLATFNPRYKFFSWIYRIAVNETINFLNMQKVHEKIEGIGQNQLQVKNNYEQEELSSLVFDALQQLKPVDRSLIAMKYYQGFSYSEIGELLNMHEAKVKAKLYSSRQNLKNVLIQKGYIDD